LKHCIFRIAKRFEEDSAESFFSVPITSKSELQALVAAHPSLADKLVAVGNATGDDSLL
jgi:hypothetical protein